MITGPRLWSESRWFIFRTMKFPQDIASLGQEDLLRLVAEQQRLIDQLQRQVTTLTATIEALRAENAQIRRSAKRQAAPFSKGTRVSQPKRPGRKPGAGTFSFGQPPGPEEITEPPVDVPVTLEACPECGGRLEEERVDFAYITDIPPMPRPKVTQYRVRVCQCSRCGQQVRGQHPDLAPDQFGATAHRVGSRTMAAAHTLHYGVGIPVRKVPENYLISTPFWGRAELTEIAQPGCPGRRLLKNKNKYLQEHNNCKTRILVSVTPRPMAF